MPIADMTGRQKAAVLMVSLGPEIAAQIYRHLRDEEIETLTREIANTSHVRAEVRDEVLNEFYEMYVAREYVEQGGIDYARASRKSFRSGPRRSDIIPLGIYHYNETLQCCSENGSGSAFKLYSK